MKKILYNWIVPLFAAIAFVSMGHVNNFWYDICASLIGFALMDIYAKNYDKYN